jgi:methyltransferase
MTFPLFLSILILVRVLELLYSRHNEKWLRNNGAIEYGRKHYPVIVILHTFFIVSLGLEYFLRPAIHFSILLFWSWMILIILKLLVIASLGHYWNTKILRIPGRPLIRTGIYRYFRHPNYTIVILEIMLIPLVYGLYYTSIIFSVLNAMVLYIRIREENKALTEEPITP